MSIALPGHRLGRVLELRISLSVAQCPSGRTVSRSPTSYTEDGDFLHPGQTCLLLHTPGPFVHLHFLRLVGFSGARMKDGKEKS